MRMLSKIAADAIAASLSVCAVSPVNAAFSPEIQADISVSAEDYTKLPSFTSDEEMLKYVRAEMKARNENIKVMMSGKTTDDEKRYSSMMLKDLFYPTGDPAEGRYLYLGLSQNVSWVHAVDGGVVIEVTPKYRTTAAQEKQLDTAIETVRNFVSKNLMEKLKNSSDAEKVSALYDYFVTYMKSRKLSDSADPASMSSAYSAAITGTANEIGYLQLFIRLLAEFDIPCSDYYTNYDSSNPLSAHYIAAVSVDDTYYLCDPVWDFKIGSDTGSYKFLLKGMSDIDSQIPASSEFIHKHLTMFGITVSEIAAENGFSMFAYDKKFEFGDVSGDGLVDSVDASAILAEYARLSAADKRGIFSAGQKKSADVDENGKIDSVDTSLVLSYYAYKSTKNDNLSFKDYISIK